MTIIIIVITSEEGTVWLMSSQEGILTAREVGISSTTTSSEEVSKTFLSSKESVSLILVRKRMFET
jgi:hypothetical protein